MTTDYEFQDLYRLGWIFPDAIVMVRATDVTYADKIDF